MNNIKTFFGLVLAFVLLGGTWYASADTNTARATTVANISPQASTRTSLADVPDALGERATYVFGAPPGRDYAEQTAMYQPIAELLTRVTGKRFVYHRSDNWLSYSRDMTSGVYDLVFDSAAFNSWRMERIRHVPLLRLGGDVVYVIVARADDLKIHELMQLAGHGVCAPPPPDISTLTLLTQFDNPVRQPAIVESSGLDDTYKKLMQGKCVGAIMTRHYLNKIGANQMKVLFQSRALPNRTLSAGPRVSPALKDLISQTLLSPQGRAATAKLRATFDADKLIPARGEDYAGLGKLLKGSIYYY